MKKSTVGNAVIFLFGFIMAVVLTLDLARLEIDVSSIKYFPIVLFAIALMFFFKGKSFGDPISLMGLCFFISATIFFTMINDPDWRAILSLAGYFVCLIMYIASSKNDGSIERAMSALISFLAVIFCVINFVHLWNPDAYTFQKNQFSGALKNPNYFSGLCGFFLVFLASGLSGGQGRFKKGIIISLICAFAVFLFLASSRGALLATLCALLFIKMNKSFIKYIFAGGVCIVLYVGFMHVGGYTTSGISFERDLFEDTGRMAIFNNYIHELSARYFIWGTGLVEGGGRIKSELSYLDIILFSGVGAIGYFVFLARSLWFCLALRGMGAAWVSPVFIFLAISSTVEGYAANVASLLSVFTYVIAGLVYFNYLQNRINKIGSPIV